MRHLSLSFWLGVTCSFAAASMWPSIPLVVAPTTLGTAMGLTTSIQMIGIGISNWVVGKILGKDDNQDIDVTLRHWKYVMISLLGNTICCIAATFFLNVNDRRRSGILNIRKKQKLLLAQQSEPDKDSPEIDSSEDDPLPPDGPGQNFDEKPIHIVVLPRESHINKFYGDGDSTLTNRFSEEVKAAWASRYMSPEE
jgi:hypothetical protein